MTEPRVVNQCLKHVNGHRCQLERGHETKGVSCAPIRPKGGKP